MNNIDEYPVNNNDNNNEDIDRYPDQCVKYTALIICCGIGSVILVASVISLEIVMLPIAIPVFCKRYHKLKKCIKKWRLTLSENDKYILRRYLSGTITINTLLNCHAISTCDEMIYYLCKINSTYEGQYKYIPIYFCREIRSIRNKIPDENIVIQDLNIMLNDIRLDIHRRPILIVNGCNNYLN
jgi:hypothetical protein